MKHFAHARWIWNGDSTTENQHVRFRTVFESVQPGDAPKLRISADSDFVVWLNGIRIGQGQYSDWPEAKTVSTFDTAAALRPGCNVLAVLVYYRGRGFCIYAPGPPGVIAELGGTFSSTAWRCRPHPAFASGEIAVTTNQLGFCAAFDARLDDGWTSPDYDDSGWEFARETGGPDGFRESITPRPVPPLQHLPIPPAKVVMQGVLCRDGEKETFARSIAADLLRTLPRHETFEEDCYHQPPVLDPARAAGVTFRPLPGDSAINGRFLVVDLGAETAGLVTLQLTAPAGTVCDLSVGEHLADGRVRAKIAGRNFGDRYLCKEGENRFAFPFRRAAGRYVELHITGADSGTVKIDYLGLTPTVTELPAAAGFTSSDGLADRRYAAAVRTLELCMHEHYEDCPWREQSLYACDSRNQALYGYYRWGNYAFARASIDLLGRGIRPDGLLELCAPCRIDLTIPAFSFIWVAELAEYELHSGDTTLFEQFREQIAGMIATALSRRDQTTGLLRLPPEEYCWHFYEWTAGLDGHSPEAKSGLHAAYNLYFYEMAGAFLEMLAYRKDADEELAAVRRDLAAAIRKHFWNPEKHAYAAILGEDGKLCGYHEHIQALALYNRIVPADQIALVLDTLKKQSLTPVSFSALGYLVRALTRLGSEAEGMAAVRLAEAFDPLVQSGAGTLWETPAGADDFGGAGSLCHAWSSIDVYFDHAEVLGIKPLTPGFARFSVSPMPGRLHEAKGGVATPQGPISVEWTRSESGLRYHANGPESLRPELRPRHGAPIVEATYNGVAIPPGQDESNPEVPVV